MYVLFEISLLHKGDYVCIFKYVQMQGMQSTFCGACKKNTVLKYYFRVWDRHETR